MYVGYNTTGDPGAHSDHTMDTEQIHFVVMEGFPHCCMSLTGMLHRLGVQATREPHSRLDSNPECHLDKATALICMHNTQQLYMTFILAVRDHE